MVPSKSVSYVLNLYNRLRDQTMRISIVVVFGSVLVAALVTFVAYYFMFGPFQPRLDVDDPEISSWLHQDGVVVHRRGEELSNSRMYIVEGERSNGGCSWHVRSTGSDQRFIISREVATNHRTCEILMEEGSLAR